MDVEVVEQKDRRLGRNKAHDAKSLTFPMALEIDRSTWRSREIRLYDPWPNPDQPVGCCTGVAKSNQFNSVGNRRTGKVHDMEDALRFYSRATTLDPWAGTYPPDDTGSSGLASAKAAQQLGDGGEYRWLFGGADEVVQAIVNGLTVSVGTWWYWGMFNPDADGLILPSGGKAGGHQYIARGYDKAKDLVEIRCWWGPGYRDVWMHRQDLNGLLLDDGDAHWQVVA